MMSINSQTLAKIISRRGVLGTAAALAATPAFADCQIGPPAHDKGPRVWMDLDQVELDAAYDQSVYAPLIRQILKRYASSSNEAHAHRGEPSRFADGPTPVEALDVYPARTSNAPVFVFAHGGAWRGGVAKDYAYPAELFVNAGVTYVALDFINVGGASGDIGVMADQVRRGIAWAFKKAARYCGGPQRFFFLGSFSRGPLFFSCFSPSSRPH